MSPDAEEVSSPEPDFDESGIMAEEKNERASIDNTSPPQGSNSGGEKPKSSSKDPNRPRRKKARRACYACQRAHLTCGDERPCLRCIKRGLQDQCHDGVRKKAKYLHDAPPEALVPGYHGQYAMNGGHGVAQVQDVNSASSNDMTVSQSGNYFPPNSSAPYNQYGMNRQPQMTPQLVDTNMMNDFNQPSIAAQSQYSTLPNQQVSPEQSLDQPNIQGDPQSFDQGFLDRNDASMYNFDLSGLNFGNHYGALEFGMLGHMSSGAVGTPEVDFLHSSGGHSHQGSVSYDGFAGNNNFGYHQSVPWQTVPSAGSRQSSSSNLWTSQNPGMEAFAIGEANSLTGQSPQSQACDYNSTGYQSATVSPETQFQRPDNKDAELLRQSFPQKHQFPSTDDAKDPTRKLQRDTAEIYNLVKEPYPYTQGFHALTALLQKRFPSKKTLRIAKALASIRPLFISCNQNLNQADLIFMEKSLQRTLFEYENFISQTSVATLICRRTGEIVAASKEFSILSGWRQDILLGKEPNLNVNSGGDGPSGTHTGTTSREAATPRVPNNNIDTGRPQAVFLAEVMDQDSVVHFYESFAELLFGASRSAIESTPCHVLKYRTKDEPGWGSEHLGNDGRSANKSSLSQDLKSDGLVRGQAGMNALGKRDGKVDCRMCWSIRRDVFDMPMLIVLNFLPVI